MPNQAGGVSRCATRTSHSGSGAAGEKGGGGEGGRGRGVGGRRLGMKCKQTQSAHAVVRGRGVSEQARHAKAQATSVWAKRASKIAAGAPTDKALYAAGWVTNGPV